MSRLTRISCFCLFVGIIFITSGCCCYKPYHNRVSYNPYEQQEIDWYAWPKESMEPRTRRVQIPRYYESSGSNRNGSWGAMPQVHDGWLMQYE